MDLRKELVLSEAGMGQKTYREYRWKYELEMEIIL